MKGLYRVFVVFFLIIPLAGAETFEVRLKRSHVYVPYFSAHGTANGALILIKGESKDQDSLLIRNVVKQLSSHGWSVVVIDTAKYSNNDWTKLLPELISELRQKKYYRIVLLHYGNRLNDTLGYFLKPKAKQVNGLVLLSAYDEAALESAKIDLHFPVYDIVGQFDYDYILMKIPERAREFAKSNYRQVTLPGAQHDFEYSQKLLLSYIQGWINRLPETRPVPSSVLLSYIHPIKKEDSVMELVVSKPQ